MSGQEMRIEEDGYLLDVRSDDVYFKSPTGEISVRYTGINFEVQGQMEEIDALYAFLESRPLLKTHTNGTWDLDEAGDQIPDPLFKRLSKLNYIVDWLIPRSSYSM